MSGDGSRTRRMRLLAIATLLATFLAGAVVGTAVERARGDDAPRERAGMERGPRRGPGPQIFAAGGEMGDRLGLTAQQRDSIQRILERDRAKADTLFREMRPRLRARFDSTRSAIEAVLTPEQREEFRRIRREQRAERRRREDRPARPRGE
jgi:Spy/CpxP family protein refolding chaperone